MQLKGVNNQESLQRQRSAVVQCVHAQLLLHPSHDSVAWRFSFMLHCPCLKVLSAIFFPPSSESRYCSFSSDIFQCDGCLFLFPFCVGLMATIPILTYWNTFRKHNINLVISWIRVFCPSCSRNVRFRRLLRHKRLRSQHWKGREEKVCKCFENHDREWRLCHCATHGGIIPSKGWLPKMEAGILQAPNLN